MFCRYTGLGSSYQNFFNDIILLLTGTTDVNSLSSNCNKVVSYIDAGVNSAGWTVYDNVSATVKVLTSQCHADNWTGTPINNYVKMETNLTYGWISFISYELWNAGTHTGTNPSGTMYFGGIGSTGGGAYLKDIAISSNNGHGMLLAYRGVDGITYPYSAVIISERDRKGILWDTNTNAYPLLIQTGYYGTSQTIATTNTRIRGSAGDVNGSFSVIGTNFGTVDGNNTNVPCMPTTYIADSISTFKYALSPIYVYIGGEVCNLSKYTGVYASTHSYGAHLNQITVGASTYVIVESFETQSNLPVGAPTNRLAVLKG